MATERLSISTSEATDIAQNLFGIQGNGVPLPGERDWNFLLTTPAGERFVLKVATNANEFPSIRQQVQWLNRLPPHRWIFPRFLVSTLSGEPIVEWMSDSGQRCLIRVATYCPGRPWAAVQPADDVALFDYGAMLGWLDGQWSGADYERTESSAKTFGKPNSVRELQPSPGFVWDLSSAVNVIDQRLHYVTDNDEREWIEQVRDRFDQFVRPHRSELRQSVIHNDANDYNVLVQREAQRRSLWRVAGLIDFGDMVFSHTINELAIAIAYAVTHVNDELSAACQLTEGYCSQHALTESEVESLWGLAMLRQAVSLANSAAALHTSPDNSYLAISRQAMRCSLPRLLAINHRLATAALRSASGFAPSPKTRRVIDWLASGREQLRWVLPTITPEENCARIDLGVGSDQLSGDPESFAYQTTDAVAAALAAQHAVWGVGAYDEARLVYAADQFASDNEGTNGANRNPFGERRTIHLGLDLFAPAGAPVALPLSGIVEVATEIDKPLDYGGVIVVRHQTDDGVPFYTLYGHLSRDSVRRVRPQQRLAAGEPFAELGTESENGGWAPHVHVQLIVDDLELRADFPGVCRASQRSVWKELSPDPQWLMPRLPAHACDKGPPHPMGLAERRRRRFGGNVRLSYRQPLEIVRGWMQYLYDAQGRRYLDAFNNVPHVGHCHPRVAQAVSNQSRLLNSNSRYLSALVIEYAERLVGRCPPPLEVCYLLNSASEANELAVRLARAATAGRDFIVMAGAYHGNTTTLTELSPYKHTALHAGGSSDWVHVVPLADDYRGPARHGSANPAAVYVASVAETIGTLQAQGRTLAGWIAESCPSVAGQIILPQGYLTQVYQLVRAAGGVVIADEVQTGFGRMGDTFFAFESEGVVPDVIVLGKPMANGFPLAAVVTTRAIAEAFAQGPEFFSTYGGNQVACAAGMAVLDVLDDEQLMVHAAHVGTCLRRDLDELQRRHYLIGDVRGRGLFWGLELVRNRETLEPADHEAEEVVESLKRQGVLIGRDGLHHNVLKIRPPMPFSEGNAGQLVCLLDNVLERVER